MAGHIGVLAGRGCFPWVLLLAIVINPRHGPGNTETRFNQMKAATDHIMATQSHLSYHLFQAHIGDFLSDLDALLAEVDWQSSRRLHGDGFARGAPSPTRATAATFRTSRTAWS